MYPSAEHEAERFVHFVNNLHFIRNFKSDHVHLAVNQFADLSTAEFKELYLGFSDDSRSNAADGALADVAGGNETLPAAVDWVTKGAVTAVKNQKHCGRCLHQFFRTQRSQPTTLTPHWKQSPFFYTTLCACAHTCARTHTAAAAGPSARLARSRALSSSSTAPSRRYQSRHQRTHSLTRPHTNSSTRSLARSRARTRARMRGVWRWAGARELRQRRQWLPWRQDG